MDNIASISRILGGFTFLLSIAALYYESTIYRKRKEFIRDMENYAKENPDEVVNDEDVANIMSRYENLFIKSNKYSITLIVITAVLGIISIILRE